MEKCKHKFNKLIHYYIQPNRAKCGTRKRSTFQCTKCGYSSLYLIAKCGYKVPKRPTGGKNASIIKKEV